MPNNITNIIKAPQHVLSALSGKGTLVDFNSLLPMPEELHQVKAEGTATRLAELLTGRMNLSPSGINLLESLQLSNCIRDLQKGVLAFSDKQFENFVQILRNARQHGAMTWYDWACDNWGTKWNAYDVDVHNEDGGVQFDTAWSAPRPVIEALVAKFPDERIEHLWADEDIGHNFGHRIYEGGQVTNVHIEDPTDFALTVRGSEREYYRKNKDTGKWEYYDADEEA